MIKILILAVIVVLNVHAEPFKAELLSDDNLGDAKGFLGCIPPAIWNVAADLDQRLTVTRTRQAGGSPLGTYIFRGDGDNFIALAYLGFCGNSIVGENPYTTQIHQAYADNNLGTFDGEVYTPHFARTVHFDCTIPVTVDDATRSAILVYTIDTIVRPYMQTLYGNNDLTDLQQQQRQGFFSSLAEHDSGYAITVHTHPESPDVSALKGLGFSVITVQDDAQDVSDLWVWNAKVDIRDAADQSYRRIRMVKQFNARTY